MKKLLVVILTVVLLATPLLASAGSFNTHNPTAFISMQFQCGCKGYGTGVMVGRYGLLTAGQNLHCKYHGKGLKSCIFLFGAKSQYVGNKKYYNGFTYHYWDTFETGYNAEWDVGFVIFKYAVGDNTGWYNMRVCSDSELEDAPVRIMNYNTSGHFGESSAVISGVSNLQLTCDGVLSGGEGGPVCLWENDMPYIVGIYTDSSNGTITARRFTQQIYDDLKAGGAFD